MRLVSLRQGSPEWLAWRSQGVGSSDAAAIVGASPWTTREALLLAKQEALRGAPAQDRDNWAMARGRRLEPHARASYEGVMGWASPAACAEHAALPWLRASCDGWEPGRRLPLEIKCPGRADHEEALAGRVPAKYLPQVTHLMLVTGATSLHYWSYSDRFPPGLQAALVEVPRREEECMALLDVEAAFWEEVTAAA